MTPKEPESNSADRLQDLMALQDVPRWTVVKVGRAQSVAEHSFNVAAIALELASRLCPELVGEVLLWSILHDGPESHTGDIPGIIKKKYNDGWVSKVEMGECAWFSQSWERSVGVVQRLVKVADLIESLSYLWLWKVGSHADSVWRYLDGLWPSAVADLAESLPDIDSMCVLAVTREVALKVGEQKRVRS